MSENKNDYSYGECWICDRRNIIRKAPFYTQGEYICKECWEELRREQEGKDAGKFEDGAGYDEFPTISQKKFDGVLASLGRTFYVFYELGHRLKDSEYKKDFEELKLVLEKHGVDKSRELELYEALKQAREELFQIRVLVEECEGRYITKRHKNIMNAIQKADKVLMKGEKHE